MVIVEITLKKASTGESVPLGKLEICNNGGTDASGNYSVRLFNKAGREFKGAIVRGFPRKRLTSFHLVQRALNAAFGGQPT